MVVGVCVVVLDPQGMVLCVLVYILDCVGVEDVGIMLGVCE